MQYAVYFISTLLIYIVKSFYELFVNILKHKIGGNVKNLNRIG